VEQQYLRAVLAGRLGLAPEPVWKYNRRSEEAAMTVHMLAVLLVAWTIPNASDDLQKTYDKLQAAVTTKDSALVKELAVQARTLARQVAAEPASDSDATEATRAKRVAWAEDVGLYAEYALYATAIAATDPAVTVDLLAALEQANPRSKYLDDGYAPYIAALVRTKAKNIPAVAERAVKNFPENEDLLLILADDSMNRKQTDRALTYAERLIAAAGKHPKPEGMSAADWERKRTLCLSRGRWIAGMMHSAKGQYYEADRDLRAALPMIRGNDAMAAPALFYLGVANYQLGSAMRDRPRILEGARFSEECSKIKSSLAEQAWRNAQAMKAEAQKVR
jgi:hypothetical protein